jgi:hypothetical protein
VPPHKIQVRAALRLCDVYLGRAHQAVERALPDCLAPYQRLRRHARASVRPAVADGWPASVPRVRRDLRGLVPAVRVAVDQAARQLARPAASTTKSVPEEPTFMSHVVTIQTKVFDPAGVAAACQRLNLAAPVAGTARLFSGEATGLVVQLPGWQYPVVIDTLTGAVHFDNYGGAWKQQTGYLHCEQCRFCCFPRFEPALRTLTARSKLVVPSAFSDHKTQWENPMSHIVTIETKVHDPAALTAACRRLGLAEPVHGTAKLYSGEATGLSVNLPGWQYPLVVDTAAGSIKYDNYEGRWGDPADLQRLLQMYAVEKAKLEARRKGYCVTEQLRQDGSIVLQIAT